ncbi:ketosteroid isomerase-like protein [Variovorax boronicumulans]|uniref:nuclear transport factor 2 family protein n=1 Tax=Variovorax boronicumulans TaxID=436515 RepID=UPI00277E74C9|nr:nuclear transport factor 2 family protein [Variovorax boronicumulans]MDQ0012507.1 ketosteroid isomerase-like protein [Variovorax boronicumulans]
MLIKKFFLIAASVAVFTGCAMAPAGGGASDQASVAAAAERLRIAMVDPTAAALGALVADDLSYGHSGGKVDTKASFISDLLDGKSDFVTITITEQTIKVVDANTAIVRHTLAADTNDSGKPGKVALKILGVWQKQGGNWKLLARQAVRVNP